MIDAVPESTASDEHSTAKWVCRNCGHFNRQQDEHCDSCGFARNYDPESVPAVSFAGFKSDLAGPLLGIREKLLLYLSIARDVLLSAFAIVALVIGARMLASWPFPLPFERDADLLVDAVLLVQASVDEGVTYEQYSTVLTKLVIEKTKFEKKYGESEYRQRVSYQKLAQAAEYYILARQAWANDMRNSDIRRVDLSALTTSAPNEVLSRWATAADNAMQAIVDLR